MGLQTESLRSNYRHVWSRLFDVERKGAVVDKFDLAARFLMILDLLAKLWKHIPSEARQFLTRSFQTKFTISAAAIVTNDRGQVLLLDHLLRPRSGWGFPGGFLEKNEQPEAAVRREVREETGLELRDVSMHRVRTIGRHIEIIFVATAVGEAVVNSPEIKSLRWFSVNEIPRGMALDLQFIMRRARDGDK